MEEEVIEGKYNKSKYVSMHMGEHNEFCIAYDPPGPTKVSGHRVNWNIVAIWYTKTVPMLHRPWKFSWTWQT